MFTVNKLSVLMLFAFLAAVSYSESEASSESKGNFHFLSPSMGQSFTLGKPMPVLIDTYHVGTIFNARKMKLILEPLEVSTSDQIVLYDGRLSKNIKTDRSWLNGFEAQNGQIRFQVTPQNDGRIKIAEEGDDPIRYTVRFETSWAWGFRKASRQTYSSDWFYFKLSESKKKTSSDSKDANKATSDSNGSETTTATSDSTGSDTTAAKSKSSDSSH